MSAFVQSLRPIGVLNLLLLLFSSVLLILRTPPESHVRFLQVRPAQETPNTREASATFATLGSGELQFVSEAEDPPAVHSGTLTQLRDQTLLAAWFGGTREGAKDVQIYLSRLERGSNSWSAPVAIASREQTSSDLDRYVSKLGNPVLFADSTGRVWLYYVTVSFGGWSGSSICVRYSDDQGTNWSTAKRLVTSPFLNVSTLVKGAPVECESGLISIPVYHEFLRKFGENLLVDREGQLVSKVRLTSIHGTIQPWIVPLDSVRSRAFYRRSGHSSRVVLTELLPDMLNGQCGALELTNAPNPDSSVAVIRKNDGQFLMAFNPLETGRHELALATSTDGVSWKTVKTIEQTEPPGEFSYPYLIQGSNGEYHLMYTWNRKRMRFLTFDDSWLENEE